MKEPPTNETRAARRLSRREVLRAAAAVAGGGVLARAADTRPAASAPACRNAIVIVTDTMRRDALGCFGGDWVGTPNLDAFARCAVRMDRAFLSSFPTVPCRNDILVGRHSFAYKPWEPIDAGAITLPDILAAEGFQTAFFGDTPHPYTPNMKYQRGFDTVRLYRGQENDPLEREPETVKLPCDPKKLRAGKSVVTQYLRNVAKRQGEEDYFVAQTMRGAAEWLTETRRPDARFFLYVDTFDPHEPWDPPPSYLDAYDPGYRGEKVIYPRYEYWREFLSERELRHCRAMYAAEATLADRWIGVLLETIDREDLLDDTFVIVTTDHGFLFGEHGLIGKALIRNKVFQNVPLWPEICRIPMIVSFPGCPAGSRRAELVQHVDIAPTVLDFLGVAKPSFLEGRSMRPFLGGGGGGRQVAIGSPTVWHKGMTAPNPTVISTITDGRWLLLYGAQTEGTAGAKTSEVDMQTRDAAVLDPSLMRPALHDIEADPACERNLLKDHPRRARELHAEYVATLDRLRVPPEQLAHFRRPPV